MSLPAFANRYQHYLAAARSARAEDLHHDQRRELFLGFLYEDTNGSGK